MYIVVSYIYIYIYIYIYTCSFRCICSLCHHVWLCLYFVHALKHLDLHPAAGGGATTTLTTTTTTTTTNDNNNTQMIIVTILIQECMSGGAGELFNIAGALFSKVLT